MDQTFSISFLSFLSLPLCLSLSVSLSLCHSPCLCLSLPLLPSLPFCPLFLRTQRIYVTPLGLTISRFRRSPPSEEGNPKQQKAERCESAPLLPITRVLNYGEDGRSNSEEEDEEGRKGVEGEEGGSNADGRIPPLTSAAARRRISAAGIHPPPPTPLHGATAAASGADHHHQQQQASSAGMVGDVLSQVVQAVSNAEGRRLVCDVAGSVTAEAVRTTVSSLLEAAGFSSRASKGVRARPGKGQVNGARIHEEGGDGAAELLEGAGELVEVDAAAVASPGLYLAIFACLAVQLMLLVQQYSAFAASGI